MHLNGLKILTQYHSGWKHLDAGTSMTGDRQRKIIYSTARNYLLWQHLYVIPNNRWWLKPIAAIVNAYRGVLSLGVRVVKCILLHDTMYVTEHLRGKHDGKVVLKMLTESRRLKES
jgi:hypothetical protein